MIFNRDPGRKGDQLYQKGEKQKAAVHYLKAKRYEQAAGVFAELGEVDRAVEIYEEQGNHLAAGDLLGAQGRLKDASLRYEKAGAYRQAAEAALEARSFGRAARMFEQAEMFIRAADCFLQIGESEYGATALEKGSQKLQEQRGEQRDPILEKEIRGLDLRRAEILNRIGRNLEAAELFKDHGQTAKAASLFEKVRSYGRAAAAYLEAGLLEAATEAAEKADDIDDELLAEIYLNCARHTEAAQIFERMERFDAAASAYEDDEDWEKAAENWEKAGVPHRAAGFYLRAERFTDAGRAFEASGQHREAADAFRRGKNLEAAAESLVKAGNKLGAAEALLKIGRDAEAQELLQAISAEETAEHARASVLLIPLLVEGGMLDSAEARLEELKDDGEVPEVDLLYCRGRVVEASGRFSAAERLYQKVLAERHDYRDAMVRLQDVRGKIAPPAVTTSGANAGRDTEPVAQQPSAAQSSARKPVGDSTARRQFLLGDLEAEGEEAEEESSRATDSVQRQPSVGKLSSLFEIGPVIDPWWNGARFFEATDQSTREKVTLVSFPLAELGPRADALRKAVRQLTALEHPTILGMKKIAEVGDKVLLVYPYFSSRSLEHLLAEQEISAKLGVFLLVQMSEALAAAHKLGVIHQWLSPRTVLIDDQNRVRLVGLGLGEIIGYGDDTSRIYLSPELRTGGVIGPATDVFCLGLLAMTLLNAQLPTDWSQKATVDPKSVQWPAEVEQAIPARARDSLVHCLDQNPMTRPSASELQTALTSGGLLQGQVLNNRYEIVGELGTGGMSKVYRARDLEFDDEVAIKTLITPSIGRSEDEERLLREVQICRKITHPNVVRVHDMGRFPGGIFIIMELLEGPGLDQVILEQAPLPLHIVRKLLGEIAAALAEAHRLKIIHRDLKPGNVILVDGRVKVLDFGIARMNDGSSAHLTRTGEVIGSPLFMAPEQIQGKSLTGACDLYALGVIAFTMLTGREPFISESSTEIVLQHIHNPPPDVRTLRPELSEPWSDLLERLLAKDPAERYASADEMIEAVARLPTEEAP